MKNNVEAFCKGVVDSIPIVLGYIPVGIAFGVAAQGAGLSMHMGVLISILVFAGGSQFALVELIKGGNPLITTVFASLGLNLRHILYGPAIATFLKEPGSDHKIIPIVAFGLTDEVFASAMLYFPRISPKYRYWWLLGIEIGAYLAWITGTWIGSVGSTTLLLISPVIAPALVFAPAALFFVLLLPMLKKHTILPVIVAAGTTIIFKLADLSSYGIIAAAFGGTVAGVLGEKIWKNS